MKKLKNRLLAICTLFVSAVVCVTAGIASIKDERGFVAVTADTSASTVVLNDVTWTGSVSLTNNGGSAYNVTWTTSAATLSSSDKAIAINNNLINEVNVRDYLLLNGETLTEWIDKVKNDNFKYLSATLDGTQLSWGATWNPAVVYVNGGTITMTINRNYLPASGLEFGLKDGFAMQNGDTMYKTNGDLLFKVIPDTTNLETVKVVKAEEAETLITTARYTVDSYYANTRGTDYIGYRVRIQKGMGFTNGRWLCDHYMYLNDYITIENHTLTYWNTVTYKEYTWDGAPAAARIYQTPVFALAHTDNTSLTQFTVYMNKAWLKDQGFADENGTVKSDLTLGIADGMLYVGTDGKIYEQGTPTEVMNDNWTATVTLPIQGGSMYRVTLNYPSEFNPEAAWANDHATINGIDVRDWIVLNGKTMKEWSETATGDSVTYFSSDTGDGMFVRYPAWNPVAVCVNKDNIEIQINRNYLAPGGLEFGIKSGFTMTNNDTIYKVTEDVMFKLVPDLSNVQNLKTVKADTADITKNNIEYSVTPVGTNIGMMVGTTGNYAKYELRIPNIVMDFTNNGWALSNNYTYLNDYITVNGKPLTYWNTVKYDANYNYTGAPATGRVYATPTFGQMYANAEGGYTVIYVFVNNDLNLTNPEIGLADGMLYPAGGKIYEQCYVYSVGFEAGASIRYVKDNNDDSGIRFTASVDEKLATAATEVGMLIVPETYINAYNESGYNDYFRYFDSVKGKSKESISVTFTKEQIESGTLKGCIVGIKDKNWTRSYQAVTYYVSGGEYYYSEPSDARTIAYVADKALTDVNANYGDTLETSLAAIVEKSLSSATTLSGAIEDTTELNTLFGFNVSGNTAWSVVSGTAATLSGSTATIEDSGDVVLEFSAYDGKLTKQVTLTVNCFSDVRKITKSKQYTLSKSLFLETSADVGVAAKTQMDYKGTITVDNSPITVTAYYHPVVGLVELESKDVLSGKLVVASGLLLQLDDIYLRLEDAIEVNTATASLEDADAEYYTFADLPPRGTETNLKQYFDLGFTTYLLTTDGFPNYIEAAQRVAATVGKTVMVRNMGASVSTTNTWFTDNNRWTTKNSGDIVSGNTNTFAQSLSDLYAENKISALYMSDEFYSTDFDNLSDLITWKNTNAKDALWHMNLVGSLSFDHWESGYTESSGNDFWDWITGNKYDSDACQATYGAHIQDYIDKIVKKLDGGTASVCLDCYPFREIGAGEIYDYYLFDLLTAATKTKEYNDLPTNNAEARFGICLQTYQFIQPNKNSSGGHDLGRDIASASEISLQIYTGLAMGADLFEYFSYCSTVASDGTKTNGIVNENGWNNGDSGTYTSRGNMYDYVKKANSDALPFAKATMAYDWQGTFYTKGSTSSENGTAFGRIDGLVTSDKGTMTSCSSTRDALYGRYTQGGQDGYMVVNYTDPTKAYTNTVTMNFGSCKYAIVYTAGGEAKIVPLTSGSLSLDLAKGEAAFVVPMA